MTDSLPLVEAPEPPLTLDEALALLQAWADAVVEEAAQRKAAQEAAQEAA